MKKILFDIYHLPQLNFFKPSILNLGPEKVDISCVNRGKLVDVIKHELPEYNLFIFGDYKYNNGPLSTIFRIIIPRLRRLYSHISRNNYDLIVSAGSAYQASFVSWLKNIPSVGFSDDPRKFTFNIAKYFSNDFYIPTFSYQTSNVSRFHALKEWAYLSPDYFLPDRSALLDYGLTSGDYIFIRDVSTNTLNYQRQSDNKIQSVAAEIKDNVVLSLEKKQNHHLYPKEWLVLEEPVSDIYSLMYYSKFVISTGDSMAREGGMLGVSSIYLGDRDMPANEMLIQEKILHKLDTSDFLRIYRNNPDFFAKSEQEKEQFRRYLNKKWDNVTDLILSLIYKYEISG